MNMNKTIITILLAFVVTAGWAQENADFPEDWKSVTYEADEFLPEAVFHKGVAKVNFQFVNYKPEAGESVEVSDFFKSFGVSIYYPCELSAPISVDGKATLEIPLSLVRSVLVNFKSSIIPLLLCPGEEISCLLEMNGPLWKVVAFKGKYARTNLEMARWSNQRFDDDEAEETLYQRLHASKTSDERRKALVSYRDMKINKINKSDYTSATKALQRMEVEDRYLEWLCAFGARYTTALIGHGDLAISEDFDIEKTIEANDSLLVVETPINEYFEGAYAKYAPCADLMWHHLLAPEYYKAPDGTYNRLNAEIVAVQCAVSGMTEVETGQIPNEYFSPDTYTYKECAEALRNHQQELAQKARGKTDGKTTFCLPYGDASPEDVLSDILDRYKGKVVFMDFWGTSCIPCLKAQPEIEKLAKEMPDDVQFIDLACTQSKMEKWEELTTHMSSHHFYLTHEQFWGIIKKHHFDMIPTYLIFNKHGELTYSAKGFPGADVIKEELVKCME